MVGAIEIVNVKHVFVVVKLKFRASVSFLFFACDILQLVKREIQN